MNASIRKCTEAKRCKLVNCYDCRRYLIDTTAARMLDSGVDQASVDQYRYSAINALAWEIETPKPKAPKAPKASKPSRFDLKAIAEGLWALPSRDEARRILRDLTVAELREVSKMREMGAQSKLRKAELIESLVDATVGARLDHLAIMDSAKR